MKGLRGMDSTQLVMKLLIGLLTLQCHVYEICFVLYVTLQQTLQEAAESAEPEVVQGSLSIKRLSQVWMWEAAANKTETSTVK